MANLKLDLLNKIRNDKYYDELELIRLAQEPNMNYKEKINEMDIRLTNIAIQNIKIGHLIEQYFPEQPQQPPQQAPTKTHQGQTHGE